MPGGSEPCRASGFCASKGRARPAAEWRLAVSSESVFLREKDCRTPAFAAQMPSPTAVCGANGERAGRGEAIVVARPFRVQTRSGVFAVGCGAQARIKGIWWMPWH